MHLWVLGSLLILLLLLLLLLTPLDAADHRCRGHNARTRLRWCPRTTHSKARLAHRLLERVHAHVAIRCATIDSAASPELTALVIPQRRELLQELDVRLDQHGALTVRLLVTGVAAAAAAAVVRVDRVVFVVVLVRIEARVIERDHSGVVVDHHGARVIATRMMVRHAGLGVVVRLPRALHADYSKRHCLDPDPHLSVSVCVCVSDAQVLSVKMAIAEWVGLSLLALAACCLLLVLLLLVPVMLLLLCCRDVSKQATLLRKAILLSSCLCQMEKRMEKRWRIFPSGYFCAGV